MKFTSEDLMKAMGLQVGDRVKVKYHYGDEIFTIIKQERNILFVNDDFKESIIDVMDWEYEILPKTKRIGDLKCEQYCNGCPLIALQCFDDETKNKPFYEVLDYALPRYHDTEIYDLLKARLDKEVKE